MTGATRDCSYRGVWLRSVGAERSSKRPRHPANKPATPAAASTPAVPVVAEQVKSSDVPIYLGGIGSVQAYNTVTVHSQITGPITQIAFTEGQLVHTRVRPSVDTIRSRHKWLDASWNRGRRGRSPPRSVPASGRRPRASSSARNKRRRARRHSAP